MRAPSGEVGALDYLLLFISIVRASSFGATEKPSDCIFEAQNRALYVRLGKSKNAQRKLPPVPVRVADIQPVFKALAMMCGPLSSSRLPLLLD